jgi:hypothetical protein
MRAAVRSARRLENYPLLPYLTAAGGKLALAAATALCLGMGSLPVCADDAGAGSDDLNPIIEFLRDQEKTCANILSIEKRDPVVVVICETSLTDMSSRVTHTLVVDQIGL